jgi:hypothetical protein
MSGNTANARLARDTLSDTALEMRVFQALRAALQAQDVHNYTGAKVLAEEAHRDCLFMHNRFVALHNFGDDASNPRFGTGVQQIQHRIQCGYIECADALLHIIGAHNLAHVADLRARNASPHASSASGQLVDRDVLSTISEPVVPDSDVLVWEAITLYEWYHLHAAQFNVILSSITSKQRMMLLANDPNMQQLRIRENRDKIHSLYNFRLDNFPNAQIRALERTLRESLPLLSNDYTEEQLAEFTRFSTLLAAQNSYKNGRMRGVLSRARRRTPTTIHHALAGVLSTRADAYFIAAKLALDRRDFAECFRNASLTMQASQLAVHCFVICHLRINAFAVHAKMFLTKKMMCMNEELRLAHLQEVQAANAAKECDPQRVNFYTSKATQHLDRHDINLKLVNAILQETYNRDVENNDWDVENDQENPEFQNYTREMGPLSTTVRDRIRYECMESTARREMLSNGAYALRFALRARMHNDSIFQATTGVQTAVLE